MSVAVIVEFQRVTERAILVHYEHTPVWLPKSQIENWGADQEHANAQRGNEITLVLSDWIARQKNITSSTTADDSPIDEDKYQVEIFLDEHRPADINFTVKEGDSVLCFARDERTAKMIAAAMALTEGKV